MLESYIHQLQESLVSSNRELEQLSNNVSRSQNHLKLKAQEEKTWGNLKQQKLNLHQEQAKAAEQSFFDELASTRFYRISQASAAERG